MSLGHPAPRGQSAQRAPRLPVLARQRLYDYLRGSPTGLVALALVVGAGAGVGAIVFRYLILGFTVAFSGQQDYSAAGRAPHPLVPWLGPWFVVLAPALGGLLYGPLVSRFAPEARGHGVPEVMLAVAERGGRIRPQVAAVKSLASALCIGSGGSVRRVAIRRAVARWGAMQDQECRPASWAAARFDPCSGAVGDAAAPASPAARVRSCAGRPGPDDCPGRSSRARRLQPRAAWPRQRRAGGRWRGRAAAWPG